MAITDTIGLEKDGFKDPNKEFPKKEYLNVPSTNLAASGIKKNSLYLGGGDQGLSLDLKPQEASQYPLNNVRETISGHVTEIDDTPGAERILFKHKTGAGIEMRADGTVIVSSVNNTVRITGGDEKVIVEGDGEITYNGNLTLNVTGDFDLRVGGNFNVDVRGNEEYNTKGSYIRNVEKNYQQTIKKNKAEYTLGTETKTLYGDRNDIIRGNLKEYIEGSADRFSGGTLTMTAENRIVMSAPKTNMTSSFLSLIGDSGTIGGDNIIHYAKNYYGVSATFDEGITSPTFHGSLDGTALTAIEAGKAGTAASLGAGGSAGSYTDTATDTTQTVEPTTSRISSILNGSSKGVRKITIDPNDVMKNQIDKTADYNGISKYELTTAEARSKLRNANTLADKTFVGALLSEGVISPDYVNPIPPAIGRRVAVTATPKRGNVSIGNSSRGKRKRFTS